MIKMKPSIITLTLFALFASAVFTSCETPAQKVDSAQTEVAKANVKLDNAREAYLIDIENYRKETADRIAENDKSIAEYKTMVAQQKKESKASYEKSIADLELQNDNMKRKMDDYKADGKDKWEAFKSEFNGDMSRLGQSFKDFTVKNKK